MCDGEFSVYTIALFCDFALGFLLYHSRYLNSTFDLARLFAYLSFSSVYFRLYSSSASMLDRQLLAVCSVRSSVLFVNLCRLFFKILSVSNSISSFEPLGYFCTLTLPLFAKVVNCYHSLVVLFGFIFSSVLVLSADFAVVKFISSNEPQTGLTSKF